MMYYTLNCLPAGGDVDAQQPAVPAEQPEALPTAPARRELPQPAAALAHI